MAYRYCINSCTGVLSLRFAITLVVLLFTWKSTLLADDSLPKDITVYKKPECTCCKKWIKYLEEQGYNVTAIDTWDVLAEKKRLGVPPEVKACHTAVIDGLVVEGHVTDRDIKRLLLFRPEGIIGIAVPDMPEGTPGMEKGDRKEPYNTMSFDAKGNVEVFVNHQ